MACTKEAASYQNAHNEQLGDLHLSFHHNGRLQTKLLILTNSERF